MDTDHNGDSLGFHLLSYTEDLLNASILSNDCLLIISASDNIHP